MSRSIPSHIHAFELTKISSAAVTFHLRPSPTARDGRAYHHSGWALATVNNETGELAIQSDWGNWSYRWNIGSLGSVGSEMRSCTLVEFLADRDAGHCDYLAGKLASRGESDRFDAGETVRAMRRYLIEHRVEAARAAIENHLDDPDDERPNVLTDQYDKLEYRESYAYGRTERFFYSKATVREVYDALGDLDDVDSSDLFCERYLQIDGHVLITEEPWDMACTSPSAMYQQLLHGILPAVVQACRQHIAKAAA